MAPPRRPVLGRGWRRAVRVSWWPWGEARDGGGRDLALKVPMDEGEAEG